MPSYNEPRASLIIVTQHKVDLLLGCLAAIGTERPRSPFEVIVLFNGTAQSDIERVMADVQGVRFIRSRVNLGFSGGNNFAASRARGEYLVFLNDDTRPEPGWLDALIAAADANADAGAVGSRILFPDGALQEAGAIIWRDGTTYPFGRGDADSAHAFQYVRQVDYCSANGLLVRAVDFWSAGGFDEAFYPAYYEDVDLCLALKHTLGKRVLYEPRSRILHYEASSSDPLFRSFLFQRNVERIRVKWANWLQHYNAAEPTSAIAVRQAMDRARGVVARILAIDDRIPNAGLGSGFGRLNELIADLRESEYAIDFYPAANAAGDPSILFRNGVDLLTGDLESHLSDPAKSYDAIIVSRPHNYERFGPLIQRLQPAASLIYDAEALFHRRTLMQADLEENPARKSEYLSEARRMLALEQRLTQVCQRVVCISLEERDVLESFPNHCPIDLMPPLASNVRFTSAPFSSRRGAVFVAGWLAGALSPNIPSLIWFAREVLPHVVARIPDIVVSVTGADPPESVRQMESAHLKFTGFFEDVTALYNNCRAAISPILYGAGVKIKTIEAMQSGVPVVATAVGAEGMGLRDGFAIDITDDAYGFALRLARLLTDEDLWNERRRQMREVLDSMQSQRVSWHDVVTRTLEGKQPRSVA